MNVYELAILTRAAQRSNGVVSMAHAFNTACLVKAGYMVPVPGLDNVFAITPAGREYYRTRIAS